MVCRRELIKTGAVASFLTVLGGGGSYSAESGYLNLEEGDFDSTTVRGLAKKLAEKPYRAPDQTLPSVVDNLTFDQYRSIVFDPDQGLWRQDKLNYRVEFFPRGFLYRPRVEMFEVIEGKAKKVSYNPDMFHYTDPSLRSSDDLGFAGLKLVTYLNSRSEMQEFCVFLGASYFRAIGKDQIYGLSARGFANGTGDPKGEEFALFRAFWIDKPKPAMEAIVLYALMDSPSVVGAFRFTMRPGHQSVFDVESFFHPRSDITKAGVAPLTGMFYFDANDRDHVDDWRPAAHDSEGLSIWTGSGTQIWRPLRNPVDLQFSAFMTDMPQGFGLMQRRRDFRDFEDLALHYEKRPSLWVEPIGDWGIGSVDLVEIPTPNEVNDNIVAFWRPNDPLVKGKEYAFVYRMYWGKDNPWPTRLARADATRVGVVTGNKDARFFSIDFIGTAVSGLSISSPPKVNIISTKGAVRNVAQFQGQDAKTWRITFEFWPKGATVAEINCQLLGDKGPITEQWVYRWTP